MCLTQHKGRMGRRGDRRVRPGGKSQGHGGGQEQVRSGGKGSRYVGRGKRRGEQGKCSRWKEHRFNDIEQQQSLRLTAFEKRNNG